MRRVPFDLPWIDSKVNEARAVLRKRSETRRETLRRLALWLVDGAPEPKTDAPQIDFGAMTDVMPQSPARRLRYCQEQLNQVPAVDKTLSPSWDELYAALALDLFLNAYVAGGFAPGSPGDAEDESLSPETYGSPLTCTAQAIEALAYCRLGERIGIEIASRKKMEASKAGLARHEKLLPIKREVEKLYFAHYRHLSNKQAARRIIADMRGSGDLSIALTTIAGRDIATARFREIEILKNDDVEIRFEKWIALIKKGGFQKSA